jgi:membrane protein
VGFYGAHACYFIVLSLFPGLVLLLMLLRHTGLPVEHLLDILEGILPQALLPAVSKVVISAYRSNAGVVISLSALTALWSASRGIYGLMKGLNRVFQVEEDRPWLQTRLLSVGYMFAFLLVLLLTLILNVFGVALVDTLMEQGIFWQFLSDMVDLRFLLLLMLQTGLFSAMYMALPNKPVRFSDAFPGAVLAALGWQIFSHLFSGYVEGLGHYETIYGSVYAVALGMLWLYFCICIFFYGGFLNELLSNREKL